MNATTIILALSLLLNLSNLLVHPKPLTPLDEERIQVHWIKAGEQAPFDGILLNEYTYQRMREKINQLER